MRKRRFWTIAVCALGLGISATACGVVDGAEATADETTATAPNQKLVDVLAKVHKQRTFKSTTVVEYDGELASIVEHQVRTPDLAMRTRSTVYPAAHAASGSTRTTGTRSYESLQLPNVVYSTNDPRSPLYDGDKPWTKCTLGPGAGADTRHGYVTKPKDGPLAGLDKLVGSGEVRVIGQEVVDGIRTTHYAGYVTVARLLEDSELSTEGREQVRALYQTLGMDRLTLDVWVGRDELPVKQVTVSAVRLAKPIVQKSTVMFGNWRKPVDLTPPPANEVEDLGTLPPLPPSVAPSRDGAVNLRHFSGRARGAEVVRDP